MLTDYYKEARTIDFTLQAYQSTFSCPTYRTA